MAVGAFCPSPAVSRRDEAMKRCALYARVSSDQSVQAQLIQLREIARRRRLEAIAEFSDVSVSGMKTKRSGLESLLREARKGTFLAIVIVSLDRLGKHTKHFLEVIQQLNSLGIDLISAQEALDSTEPAATASHCGPSGAGIQPFLARNAGVNSSSVSTHNTLLAGQL
jgi:predicted site-specific integrase-resolvase